MVDEIRENDNGDSILFIYNGHEYAHLDQLSGYRVVGDMQKSPIALLKKYSVIRSLINKTYLYGYMNDSDLSFIYCDIGDVNLQGNSFYRDDIKLPKVKSKNIESIKIIDFEKSGYEADISISEHKEIVNILNCYKNKDDIVF